MYKYTYSCMYDPDMNVCITSYKYKNKYPYLCNYVLSSDKSSLRLVVNKKTLSALA